jgi:hypothetical protein
MVDDKEIIAKDDITVEVKAGDNDWEVITKPPSKRGGVYRWTVSNVTPCVEHNVRIWLNTVDGTTTSFTYPKPIPAANLDEIIASGFRPEKPEDVVVSHYARGELKVSWTPSKCARLYDVTYQNVADGKTTSKQIDTQMNSFIIVDNVESCNEYEIRVTAMIGEEYSEENIIIISTQPEPNEIEKVNPILESNENSLIAKWKGFEKLSCISEYRVSVCKQDGECLTSEKVNRDDSLQFIEYKSPQILEECTEYTLNIKPMHSQVEMVNKQIQFRTKAIQPENIESLLKQVKSDVDDEQMITIQWNSIKCANHYEVFQKVNTEEEEWERVGITEESSIKKKGLPCTEYKYGVKVTIDDEESEIVEFDELIKISPALTLSNQQSLSVKEKANNSVTFVINSGVINQNCKVEKYHIKHNSEENYIDPLSLEEGKITVNVPTSNTEILGRIKYHGFDSWTSWISTDSPLKEKQRADASTFLLPIIIGLCSVILVSSIVVFLIIRNKKVERKYDEEKCQGVTEESKQLNKQREEIINSEKR